ncbi:MAG TPA: hypothetical protein VFR18_06135 [Terriglobia bacterium]|nr:hypothetical protein [Terriglobia bacterium]
MNRVPRFGMIVVCMVLLSPLGSAQNLLKYRDFEFGMNVDAVLSQTKMDASSAKTTFAVPDLIQTLRWDRDGYSFTPAETDPVRSVRFDFYNDQLFKIVATYNSRRLEGVTVSDLIEAISKVYGTASNPDETIIVSPYTGYEERQKVLARWENSEAAYSLFQSSLGGEFGLVGSSKKLEGTALPAIREAQRLDARAAPQREIDRQQKLEEEWRAREEKSRSLNLPNFHP